MAIPISRTHFYHKAIVILLGLIALRLWTLPVGILPVAHAQLPDEAGQRLRLVQASKKTNRLLFLLY